MSNAPHCPFCETQTKRRDAHPLIGMVDIYDCPACKSHLHRPLFQSEDTGGHKPMSDGRSAPFQASSDSCADCAFGDFECRQCGDTVCGQHVHRATNVARSLSPELRDHLLEQYTDQTFCPLCFQGKIMRLTRDLHHGRGHLGQRPKKLFNTPLILILFALIFLITLGPKRCVAERTSHQDPSYYESTSGNPP